MPELDEERPFDDERLPDERDEPERLPEERDEPERLEDARVEPERLDDERLLEPDRARVLDPDRERDDDERLDAVARLREVERRRPPEAARRSAAGISEVATDFVSVGIRRWRKFAIFSSSRLMRFASWAVSRSPTDVASVSIAVY
ncbi:MAG TPA: hypothetical protein VF752_08830 [Thermoleophilaceae bacterium]